MKKTAMQQVYELIKSGLSPEKVVNYLLIDEELMLEKEKEQMIDFVLKWMGEDDLKQDVIKHYNETYNKQ
jgi:hypothetical protein